MTTSILKKFYLIVPLILWGLLASVKSFWVIEDPRGSDRVAQITRERESAQFKDRLTRGVHEDFAWPGLRAMQTSWTWLSLLSAIHVSSSYEGDFSWLFSKLFTVSQYANEKEIYFITTLAPFYFVMGSDGAGSTLFLYELQKRLPQNYHVNFWGAFHALDNLSMKNMAAYFYEKASASPMAPDYLASLSLRLKYGENLLDNPVLRKQILETQVSPELRQRLARVRPNWFE